MSDEMVKVDEVKVDEVVEVKETEMENVKKVSPIVFMDENQVSDIEVDVVSDATSGKILYVLPKDISRLNNADIKETEKFFVFTPFNFKFSAPNWEQVSLYRQRSSLNQQGRLDKNVFRTFLLVNHLKAWDIKDSKGDLVEIDFDINGEVTKESMAKMNRVPSIIWDNVLTMVEREFGLGENS